VDRSKKLGLAVLENLLNEQRGRKSKTWFSCLGNLTKWTTWTEVKNLV